MRVEKEGSDGEIIVFSMYRYASRDRTLRKPGRGLLDNTSCMNNCFTCVAKRPQPTAGGLPALPSTCSGPIPAGFYLDRQGLWRRCKTPRALKTGGRSESALSVQPAEGRLSCVCGNVDNPSVVTTVPSLSRKGREWLGRRWSCHTASAGMLNKSIVE